MIYLVWFNNNLTEMIKIKSIKPFTSSQGEGGQWRTVTITFDTTYSDPNKLIILVSGAECGYGTDAISYKLTNTTTTSATFTTYNINNLYGYVIELY